MKPYKIPPEFLQQTFPGMGLGFTSALYRPETLANIGECFLNVARHVETNGGKRILGWGIAFDIKDIISAVHHAIWESPEGQLIDITPRISRKQFDEVGKNVPFIIDPSATLLRPIGYDVGVARPNKYWARSSKGAKLISQMIRYEKHLDTINNVEDLYK